LNGGYLTLGHFRGAPIRFHLTVVLLGLWFARGSVAAWAALVLLIFIHELGHAIVVRACGHRVVAINIHGFGGTCEWEGAATSMHASMIAWGGVWAQLALYAATCAHLALNGGPTSAIDATVISVFTTTNAWIMLLNLLPIPPLDGARAWSLFPLLVKKARFARSTAPIPLLRADVPRGPFAPRPAVKLRVVGAEDPHIDRGDDTDEAEDRARREHLAGERRFQKMVDDIQGAQKDPRFRSDAGDD
jgi:Zn-dependent protease